ncbi:MAG: YjzC family protein [Clostridia bacterium]
MKLKSGEIAPKSGTYKEVAANGRVVNTIDVKKGNRLPPTQKAQSHFTID